MSLEDDDGPEDAEQIIELVYDIVKDYPTGITSAFLEEQYEKRYVECGIARKLPKNWLRYVKSADEFEVRQVSTFSMLYIVNKDTVPKLPLLNDLADLNVVDVKDDDTEASQVPEEATASKPPAALPAVSAVPPPKIELEAWSPSSMPKGATHVHILSATDPDNISFRLCAWDPMPDYLYTALQRDLSDSPLPSISPDDIQEGLVLAAKISDASWERVKVVRRSKNASYWVVYAVDVGFFHLVHETDFRPLTEALDGITPSDEYFRQKALWPKTAQQALYDLSVAAQGKKIDLIPTGEWKLGEEPAKVPFVTCRLVVDGVDFADKLISMGLAKAS